ncbi:hypothetical protein T4B_1797 [Trichinella pseudospiralis]|uniref:Uncharacterized protein n=1 Tax=Trichinella pseudospiralis TaxID=6337 RepID=A0A0V1J7B8_TRIPS|nr:hypothetical protein T4A_8265 [Trichinella pseudospiralis]KRZ30852.1 hypothetical protein T4B_1797 [Trichinella pseudospiralis]KRZ46298.1 hypothetical protein T4C_7814 [Trichinella pseudospiralis]
MRIIICPIGMQACNIKRINMSSNSDKFQSNNPKPISSSSSSDSGFFSSFFAAGALVSGFGASAVVGAAATEADPTPLLKQFNKSPMSTLDNAFT